MEVTEEIDIPDGVFPCKLRLCVICVSEVVAGDDGGSSQDENLILDEESEVNISPEIFLKGLSILCEKLGVNEKYGTAQFWEVVGINNFVRFVCCRKCYQLLKGLVALQELILATQRSFTENVEKIEGCMVESARRTQDAEFSFNSCFLFRKDVLSNHEQRSNLKYPSEHAPARRKASKPGPACSKRSKRSRMPIAEEAIELNSCYVKLEKVGLDNVTILPNRDDDDSYHDVDDGGVSEAILDLNYEDEDIMLADAEYPDHISPPSPTEHFDKDDNDEDFKPKARRRRGPGKPRKRGRPKKKLSKEEKERLLVKRKRGRPPKPRPDDEIKIKRPRGRPKRETQDEVLVENDVGNMGDGTIDNTQGDGEVDETAGPHPQHERDSSNQEPKTGFRRKPSRARNSGRPAGRPRKTLFAITVEQAKELINDGSSIKPILAVSSENGIYSYHSIRIQRDGNALLCKHPDCNFFVGDMAYFSDQIAFRTMKLHIKHYHRLRNYRIYTNTENEYMATPGVSEIFYCCCYCDEKFQTKNNLLDHVRNSHANVEPLETLCDVCGDTMPHKFLTRHLYSHKNDEEKKLANDSKRRRAGRQKDTSIPISFPCDQCDKVWKNHTLLRIHKTSHVPLEMRKIFQCDICGERVSNHNTLRYHKQLVHFKKGIEYPYICHICNKKYRRGHKIKYEVHMRAHSGEQPYQCSQCGKGFHCKYNMSKHEKTHLDNKIQCEYCSQWYKNSKYLRTHHLKHHPDLVRSKPDRAVTEKFLNAEHRSDFIGPKMAHPCEPCGRVYVFKSQLVSHMKHGHKLFLPKSEDYPDQNTLEMQEIRDFQKATPGRSSDIDPLS